jgi:preprotein translocase subunit SecE
MAMNRAQKRMLQKQGALGADGEAVREKPQPRRPAPARPGQEGPAKEKRATPREFLREVRGELRKVAWPTRSEVINYSIIVLVAIVILTSFIALVDYGVSEFVLKLYGE